MKVKIIEAISASDLEYHINKWLGEREGKITIISINYSVATTNYGDYQNFKTVHGALIQYN